MGYTTHLMQIMDGPQHLRQQVDISQSSDSAWLINHIWLRFRIKRYGHLSEDSTYICCQVIVKPAVWTFYWCSSRLPTDTRVVAYLCSKQVVGQHGAVECCSAQVPHDRSHQSVGLQHCAFEEEVDARCRIVLPVILLVAEPQGQRSLRTTLTTDISQNHTCQSSIRRVKVVFSLN